VHADYTFSPGLILSTDGLQTATLVETFHALDNTVFLHIPYAYSPLVDCPSGHATIGFLAFLENI
jgi:hypothetical protein